MLVGATEPTISLPDADAGSFGFMQHKITLAAPRGWEVELVELSMGAQPPVLGGFQAFSNQASGQLAAIDAELVMDSSSMRVVVRGTGPVGQFTASVSGVQVG